MARASLLVLLLLGAFMSLVAASSAPTFCKCTCFKNSTIIPLGPEHADAASPQTLRRRRGPESANLAAADSVSVAWLGSPRSLSERSKSKSCSECTKAFCLGQGIDFCKEAKEDDVTTMCFQRDSNKDKIIVWAFIVGVMALLGWAAFKRLTSWRQGNPFGRQTANYAPMPNNFR
ncbi:putative MFS transporter [Dactylonectria macrodidyma]|uniref:MFS transporter n=1 Tax=Dactylonectria macrodidyma TaxID=307937 RepID=A0A9P9FUZ2_9HYPO|nr:putative MFS transporter [Dactylonectria macrodidyma]